MLSDSLVAKLEEYLMSATSEERTLVLRDNFPQAEWLLSYELITPPIDVLIGDVFYLTICKE